MRNVSKKSLPNGTIPNKEYLRTLSPWENSQMESVLGRQAEREFQIFNKVKKKI